MMKIPKEVTLPVEIKVPKDGTIKFIAKERFGKSSINLQGLKRLEITRQGEKNELLQELPKPKGSP